jgi:hypothetical protein
MMPTALLIASRAFTTSARPGGRSLVLSGSMYRVTMPSERIPRPTICFVGDGWRDFFDDVRLELSVWLLLLDEGGYLIGGTTAETTPAPRGVASRSSSSGAEISRWTSLRFLDGEGVRGPVAAILLSGSVAGGERGDNRDGEWDARRLRVTVCVCLPDDGTPASQLSMKRRKCSRGEVWWSRLLCIEGRNNLQLTAGR